MSEVGPSKEAEAKAVQDLSRIESGAELGGKTRSPVSQAEVLPWHKLQKGDCPLGSGEAFTNPGEVSTSIPGAVILLNSENTPPLPKPPPLERLKGCELERSSVFLKSVLVPWKHLASQKMFPAQQIGSFFTSVQNDPEIFSIASLSFP